MIHCVIFKSQISHNLFIRETSFIYKLKPPLTFQYIFTFIFFKLSQRIVLVFLNSSSMKQLRKKQWRCQYMTRIKPIAKNILSNPIYVERYMRPKSKLMLGIFIGFWLGYSPYLMIVLHQMKWIQNIHQLPVPFLKH